MNLSPDESRQLEQDAARRREHHETWLYQHLTVAARARQQLERAQTYGEYADLYRDRQHALAQASEHYRALLNLGGLMDDLLIKMIENEGGLTP